MCGFAGILTTRFRCSGELGYLGYRAWPWPSSTAARMTRVPGRTRRQALRLGHRRLSIVDLSPAGHQPMHSAGGRFVMAFNGEIYNHLDLRAELKRAGSSAGLARAFGYRDLAGCLRALGGGGDVAEHGGHVRHCAMGSCRSARCTWRATALAKSRCITAG